MDDWPQTRIYFFLLIFSLVSVRVFAAALKESAEDKNHDGKMDHWYWRDSKNHLVRQAVDNNGDGKPDQFYTFIHGGRDFVIREYDRNFDGKIDKRLLVHWDAGKTIPILNGTRMTRIPNPGYGSVWKEEDNDFDGMIDVYVDKRDKTKTRVGQKISTGDEKLDPDP